MKTGEICEQWQMISMVGIANNLNNNISNVIITKVIIMLAYNRNSYFKFASSLLII